MIINNRFESIINSDLRIAEKVSAITNTTSFSHMPAYIVNEDYPYSFIKSMFSSAGKDHLFITLKIDEYCGIAEINDEPNTRLEMTLLELVKEYLCATKVTYLLFDICSFEEYEADYQEFIDEILHLKIQCNCIILIRVKESDLNRYFNRYFVKELIHKGGCKEEYLEFLMGEFYKNINIYDMRVIQKLSIRELEELANKTLFRYYYAAEEVDIDIDTARKMFVDSLSVFIGRNASECLLNEDDWS